jgi:hypothetical protein
MAERLRFRPQPAEDVGDILTKLNFRLYFLLFAGAVLTQRERANYL